ncbi:UNVERIFIED_CONTAM: Disease resistance protein RGA2 [Sesamum latifolium]|uniref:Disease resistance protein RGA2 n=1 Tax=Sesamum latifolium TaxID=2727402 RepID=A0AAW2VGP2_9LAMI
MGGIGKTTLARLVYDGKRVRDVFGRRIWIYVSLDFDMVRIAKSVVESATLYACSKGGFDLSSAMLCDTNQNLEPINTQIAKKCKGLPLVVVALGCVLRCKTTEEEWHSILESELLDMPQTENVFPVLMLSYVHLLAHL